MTDIGLRSHAEIFRYCTDPKRGHLGGRIFMGIYFVSAWIFPATILLLAAMYYSRMTGRLLFYYTYPQQALIILWLASPVIKGYLNIIDRSLDRIRAVRLANQSC